jgi:hypothetical protein
MRSGPRLYPESSVESSQLSLRDQREFGEFGESEKELLKSLQGRDSVIVVTAVRVSCGESRETQL